MNWAKNLTVWTLCLCIAASPATQTADIRGAACQEGLARVESGGKWGFVDAAGSVVVPFRYRAVEPFTLGMAVVNLDGKLGVIRPDGRYLLAPAYTALKPIGYGLYFAQAKTGWGIVSVLPYLDEDGQSTNEVYPLTYQDASRGWSGGVEAIFLTADDGTRVTIPLFQIPAKLEALGIAGSQFPLLIRRIPTFSDVSGSNWFSLWTNIAYSTGVMAGTGNGCFEPDRAVTVAETLQMAANMDSRYRNDNFHTTSHLSQPWYSAAVNYCQASGIIQPGQFDDLTREITRRELAQVFAATHLSKSLPQKTSLAQIRNALSDVRASDPAAPAIWALYAKGILTGVDASHSFRPSAVVTRAEAAALTSRLARPEQRADLSFS